MKSRGRKLNTGKSKKLNIHTLTTWLFVIMSFFLNLLSWLLGCGTNVN